jgi:hypothetical protein
VSSGNTLGRWLFIVTFYSEYTRALTFYSNFL